MQKVIRIFSWNAFFDAKSMASKLVPYARLIKNISDEDLKTEYIHELNRIKENIK